AERQQNAAETHPQLRHRLPDHRPLKDHDDGQNREEIAKELAYSLEDDETLFGHARAQDTETDNRRRMLAAEDARGHRSAGRAPERSAPVFPGRRRAPRSRQRAKCSSSRPWAARSR